MTAVPSVMSFEVAVKTVLRLREEIGSNPLVKSIGLTRHDGREAVRINLRSDATDADIASMPTDPEIRVVTLRVPA